MIITICASIKFYPGILDIKDQLERLGHEVLIPPNKVKNEQGEAIPIQAYYEMRKQELPPDWVWQRKNQAIMWHFEKVDKTPQKSAVY